MLLADLGKGTSWLNMYKMTAKACEAIQPFAAQLCDAQGGATAHLINKACSHPLATEGQGCRCTHEAVEAAAADPFTNAGSIAVCSRCSNPEEA